MSWDVTDSVQDMVSGVYTNYGWQIMDETYWGQADIPGTQLSSKEYGAYTPYLEIQYTVNDPPTADANGPYYADVNENIIVDGSGSSDSDGFITEYTWDFGDGHSGMGVMSAHTYTNAGNFMVTLTVRDDGGRMAIDTTTAHINDPPVADAGGPYTCDIGKSVFLNGTGSSDYDGVIELYVWDLDNDGIFDDATGSTPEYSWREKGEYTIALRVTDDDGSNDTDSTSVTIINFAPEKPDTPTGPTEGKIGEEHTFTTSTNEPDWDSLWFKWNWGDGTESEWLGPYDSGDPCSGSHTWNDEDTFDIKVKARDSYEEESEWSDPLSVSMPKGKSNDNEWNMIIAIGECDGISFAGLSHFFNIWFTRQPINLQVLEDTRITINGREYPLEGYSTLVLRGFIGKAIWPYSWTINHQKGMESPYDFTLFGIVKYVEII
jgi:PKD repeat protein